MNVSKVPAWRLVIWPGVITLAITLLRLGGELLNWSPTLFNRAAGGGGAAIGISWLPPVFGVLFAIQLVRLGFGPASAKKAIGLAVGGVVAMVATMAVGGALGIVKEGEFSIGSLVFFTVAAAVGAAISYAGWPALGKTLLAYAVVARVPVAIVMLIAMIGDWKTHYDVLPPNFPRPDIGLLEKWLLIGAFPQFTVWIAITVLFGALFGAVAGSIASRRAAPAARAA
jgi:hypothetical protein